MLMTRHSMEWRIAQIGSTLAAGNLVYVLSQLILPPAFIAVYGVNGYGEWLALTAGVSWMQTLDCGVQTFVVNELSLQFQRGNVACVRQLQSVALRMSLAILGVGLLITSGAVTLIPLNTVLGLAMTREAVSLIVVLLAAEILLGILWGQVNGMLRSFGYPHRAELWSQTYRLIFVFLTLGLVLSHAPMWSIPAVRLLTFFGMTTVSLLDLKRLTPNVFPSLWYWDKRTAVELVRPSLWFGSFTLNQFLAFQTPLLVLNYVAGKPALVAFSVCRSFYGVVRQIAQLARSSVAPELTRLAGINDLRRLGRLFGICEGVSFTIALVGPTLAFIAAPKVVPVWTRSAEAVSIPLFAAMMVTSIINVGKDTRLALLQATNRHIKAARLCLITYGGFALGCVPCAYLWGSTGIAVLWIFAETVQAGFVHFENRAVLPDLSWWRLVMLGACACLVVRPASLLGQFLVTGNWLTAGSVLAASAIFLTIPSAWLFGLGALLPSRKRTAELPPVDGSSNLTPEQGPA